MTAPVIDWTTCNVVGMAIEEFGDTPIVKGTRWPVDAITVNYDDGVEPEEIAYIYDVSLDTVGEILRFRQEQLGNPSEVEDARTQSGETQQDGVDMSGTLPARRRYP